MRYLVLTALLAVLAFPGRATALQTDTATVGRLHVVAETEGPSVESDDQTFALPSIETAVAVEDRDFDALRQFLKRHCTRFAGCELTYETETRAILAVKAPTGQTFLVPYTEKTKREAPGTPTTRRTVLHGWVHDTSNLVARTQAGNYCIPNDYVWKDYADKALKVLNALGPQDESLAVLVEVTIHPLDGETSDDCSGFLGNIKRGR